MRKPIKFEMKKGGRDLLPPKKKHRSPSMWGDDTEAPRLIELRTEALNDLESRPDFNEGKAYFEEGTWIRLTLTVHARVENWDSLDQCDRAKAVKNVGDLDNFIAGVCDGLMAADPEVKKEGWNSLFLGPKNVSVRPCIPIAFDDDSQIMEICANGRCQ